MKNPEPIIAVLAGGVSSEREVSLGSGAACAQALARSYPTRLFRVDEEALPAGLDAGRHVVFSTLHGTFGEDGGMQRLLEAAGFAYAGCDPQSAALTMDKALTKDTATRSGVRSAPGIAFHAAKKPGADDVIRALGTSTVMKPNDQGSSVGLHLISTRVELETALAQATSGNWLIEKRIVGRELSVGVIGGRALGVVEIRPKSGVYDFTSKYTKGMTEYFAPAPLSEENTREAQRAAELAFEGCGCRDYARVDFILSEQDGLFLLEINTLPGMKETSLLPMSARCAGMDFSALVRELVAPALARFRAAGHLLNS